MKAAIVNVSVLRRLKRLDAAAVLPDASISDHLRKCEAGVKQAEGRLREAQKAVEDERQRLADMATSGDVVYIDTDEICKK